MLSSIQLNKLEFESFRQLFFKIINGKNIPFSLIKYAGPSSTTDKFKYYSFALMALLPADRTKPLELLKAPLIKIALSVERMASYNNMLRKFAETIIEIHEIEKMHENDAALGGTGEIIKHRSINSPILEEFLNNDENLNNIFDIIVYNQAIQNLACLIHLIFHNKIPENLINTYFNLIVLKNYSIEEIEGLHPKALQFALESKKFDKYILCREDREKGAGTSIRKFIIAHEKFQKLFKALPKELRYIILQGVNSNITPEIAENYTPTCFQDFPNNNSKDQHLIDVCSIRHSVDNLSYKDSLRKISLYL
ncbi:MAG: hypothetical protein J0H68_08295 [Sphingobacteriia bacterium]|nr:hypothetical protein [Sphingobacteriia bacterium]